MKFDEVERKSNQFGVARIVHSAVIGSDVTLDMTLMQATNRNMALGVAADLTALTQATGAHTYTLPAVVAGGIYEVPVLGLSAVTVTDGTLDTPVSYLLGTHYEMDIEAGLFRVIAKPAGAGADMHIACTSAAIVAGDGRIANGIAANPNIHGHIKVRGVNDIGVRVLLDLWDVQLHPSGKRQYIGKDYIQLQLTGKVFAS